MKRRQFIVASTLSLALLAALPGCADEAATSRAGRTFAPDALDGLARGLTGFDAAALPAGQDPAAARDRLLRRLGEVAGEADTPQSALAALVREDHAAGRTREVEGWVLAESELDLLVYSASLHAQAGTSTRQEAVTAATAPVQPFTTVKAWGPQKACAGSGFNVQSDGHSSLWLQVGDDAPAGLVVVVDGSEVRTTQSNGLVTTRFDPPDLERHFSKPGPVKLELFHPGRGVRQPIGEFLVTAGGAFATTVAGETSEVFREVERWGPQLTKAGEPFNRQGENDSALWVRTSCAPRDTRIRFGTELLDTQVGPDLVTARLRGTRAISAEGSFPVHLVDTRSGEEVLLGTFQVGK